jgi:hypothetical protein
MLNVLMLAGAVAELLPVGSFEFRTDTSLQAKYEAPMRPGIIEHFVKQIQHCRP